MDHCPDVQPGLSRAVQACAAFLALLTTVFFAAVAVEILPLSAATYELKPLSDSVLQSQFRQDWRLFAPNPPDKSRLTLLQTRCDSAATPSAYVDLTDAVHGKASEDSPFPSRVATVIDKIDDAVPDQNSVYYRLVQNAKFSKTNLDVAAGREFASAVAGPYRAAFRRLLSAGTLWLRLDSGCTNPANIQIRGLVVSSPVRPYARRQDVTWKPSLTTLYDTGWFAFDPAVDAWR